MTETIIQPTTGEIAEGLREHILETFECDEFGEDTFIDYGMGHSFDYEIDMAAGGFELLERDHLDRTGRLLRVTLTVTVEDLPRLITDHAWTPVAGAPDDVECTHRPDGTDATYCGEVESRHAETTR